MRSSTSVWSAICGTHFGETNAVASTAGRPAPARRSISLSFTAVGTSRGSFCSPSRGPTSTSLTKWVTVTVGSFEADQLDAFEHLLAGGAMQAGDGAVRGRHDRV